MKHFKKQLCRDGDEDEVFRGEEKFGFPANNVTLHTRVKNVGISTTPILKVSMRYIAFACTYPQIDAR